MILNVKDAVLLDDGIEYVIANKLNYAGTEYYHLIDMKDKYHILFCCFEGEDFIEITDDNLLDTLFPLFMKRYF